MRRHDEDGFTLVELLIAVTLLGIIVFPLTAATTIAFRRNVDVSGERLTESHDIRQSTAFWSHDVRSADATFTTEVRQTGSDLRGVAFSDSLNGWAVGTGGVIVTSSDGGGSWIRNDPLTSANLNGVAATGTRAWAVGDGGTIVATTDGVNWGGQSSGTGANLEGISVKDATHVAAVGSGGAVRYFNGSGWLGQSSNTGAALRGVDFVANDRVWAVGDGGTIQRCEKDCDKGNAVWKSQSPGGGTLHAVAAIDKNHAWAVGDGCRMLVTTNGNTWGSFNGPCAGAGTSLRAVYAIDKTHVYAAGADGTILFCNVACDTSGASWSVRETASTALIQDLVMLDSANGWAVGDTGSILVATGEVWGTRSSGGPDLNRIEAKDAGRVRAVGAGGAIAWCTGSCTSGSASWVFSSAPGAGDLYGQDSTDGSLKGVAGAGGQVLYCTNTCDQPGGTFVTQQAFAPIGVDFHDYFYRANNAAYAVGTGGTVQFCNKDCDKQEAVWLAKFAGGANLERLVYGDNDHAWLFGAAGTVLACSKDCDKLASIWGAVPSPVATTLYDADKIDNKRALVAGAAGTILVCDTDVIPVCQQVTLTDVSVDLHGIAYEDENHAWAVGDGGTILYCSATCDSPQGSWAPQQSGTTADLRDAESTSATVVWVVGRGGTVLGTKDVPPTWGQIEEEAVLELRNPVCPTGPGLVTFSWTASDGTLVAAAWSNEGGHLLRRECRRAPDAADNDPLTVKDEVVAVRLLKSMTGPVFACPRDPSRCPDDPETATITVTEVTDLTYTLTATRRQST